MDTLTFGECLKKLLTIRGWSAARLAREINVDPSYVGKWVRGERIPSLQSDYVNMIVKSMVIGLETSPKKPIINSFIDAFEELKIDCSNSINVSLQSLLRNAQIYSLSLKPHDRITKHQNTNEKDILNILEQIETGVSDDKRCHSDSFRSINLHTIPSYIEGRQSVLEALLSIFEISLDLKVDSPTEILITYQSEVNIFEGYSDMYFAWKNIITAALQKGHNINYFYRLNKNVSRSLKLVSEVIEWSGYVNNFIPSFSPKYGVVTPPLEIFVIKGVGALLCFSTGSKDIDRAFFFSDERAIDSLYLYSLSMFKGSDLLLKSLPTQNDFFEYITLKDKIKGDFFVISIDLYSLTIPLELWDKYLKRSIPDELMRKPHLDRLSERIRIFNEDVKKYRVRHIYQMDLIYNLIENKKYPHAFQYQKPNEGDIIEHLENIILLLRKYENFEIALLNDNQKHLIPLVHWEVKGDHTVVMTTFNHHVADADSNKVIWLAITEGTIASAFHDYYIELWERISPKYRDKEYVISWFEDQVKSLKNNI